MSSFQPNKHHLRELLIYFFNLKKSVAEAHRLLVEAYGEAALSERDCSELFQKFKNEFDVKNEERSKWPKEFKDADLEAILEENSCQTHEEFMQELLEEDLIEKQKGLHQTREEYLQELLEEDLIEKQKGLHQTREEYLQELFEEDLIESQKGLYQTREEYLQELFEEDAVYRREEEEERARILKKMQSRQVIVEEFEDFEEDPKCHSDDDD